MSRIDVYKFQYVLPGDSHPAPRHDSFVGDATQKMALLQKWERRLDQARQKWDQYNNEDGRKYRRAEGEWRGRFAYAAEILVDLTSLSAEEVIRASEARIRAAKAEAAKQADAETKGPSLVDFEFGVAS
jgi:hypothetical protein